MSLLTEALIIGGVARDLVGAAVLSHAHNAESIAEIGAEKNAPGEDDAIGTHAQLLAEKRIGFFILTFGLTVHLGGLVLKSPEGTAPMAVLALGVVTLGLIVTVSAARSGTGPAGRREPKTSSPSTSPSAV